MSAHFAAFSFVDRISLLEPGVRTRGLFTIPEGSGRFPAALMAEAVGQLAAWAAMSAVDYRGRPVAALAGATRFVRDAAPGDTLELEVEIEHCDDEAIAYEGRARIRGETALELEHCLGPMLPLADFDDPDAVRAQFRLLCNGGAALGRFRGIVPPRLEACLPVDADVAAAALAIPREAAFFADHFPRRPVYPATLLLDAQIALARRRAAVALGVAEDALAPRRMTRVKMRAFIEPGQRVDLRAELADCSGDAAHIALAASVDGRIVATARAEIARRLEA